MATLWVDAASGASGDMILGALLDAGVPLEALTSAIEALAPEAIHLSATRVLRNGQAALHCQVQATESTQHRTWHEVHHLLTAARLDEDVRSLAIRIFERLAQAEARVHGTSPEEVHFHEVGALDAIADVVGAAAGLVHLGVEEVVVTPVAVGSGVVTAEHGTMSVPVPAVARLLQGHPSYAGPPGAPATELCTPTGAAILTTVATGWGPQPAMTTRAVGIGAGTRDPAGHANVLRVLLGERAPVPEARTVVLEANVDDLDPRVWPAVIAALLEAGASDAWLTPILMKKGRPAHTLSVLVAADRLGPVRDCVFRQTSTIGMREHEVTKHALERELVAVHVGGHAIAVKLARHDGTVVNAQPEYDDVARVAHALDLPVAEVLAEAAAAARGFVARD